jgi:hypothetical protein
VRNGRNNESRMNVELIPPPLSATDNIARPFC